MGDVPLWVPLVGSVGASALTAFATYGIDAHRRKAEKKLATQDRRRAAYAAFSHTTGAMVQRCEALRLLTFIRVTEPGRVEDEKIDPSASNELMLGDLRPLHEALTDVVVAGTTTTIYSALAVMDEVSAMMRATETYVTRGWRYGVAAPTGANFDEAAQQLRDTTDRVQQVRTAFADRVRAELGEESVDWERFSAAVGTTVGAVSAVEAGATLNRPGGGSPSG